MATNRFLWVPTLAVLWAPSLAAQEVVDLGVLSRIRTEGLQHSRAMETLSYLADVYGPRLAGSPSYDAAAAWAAERLTEFGATNASLEPWGEYGMGWENNYTSIHMLRPQYQTIIGYPRTGSHGTVGRVTSDVVYIDPRRIEGPEDLEPYRGTLEGKIVFTSPPRPVAPRFDADATRLSSEDLDRLASMAPGALESSGRDVAVGDEWPGITAWGRPRGDRLDRGLQDFFHAEGVGALVYPSWKGDGGTVYVYVQQDRAVSAVTDPRPTSDRRVGVLPWRSVPSVVVAAEHYNRIMRILEKGIPVRMEVETRTSFHARDLMDYNVIAEIPGTDLAHEVVMLGAHLDGRSAATGATDAASGCTVVMEAVRILNAIGAQPRRTIRVALWGSEEPALLGSRGYVRRHFGNPETLELLPDHENLAAYFNLDEGAGRIRGVFLQEQETVRDVFAAWLRPLADLGANTLSPARTGGTDHISFNAVGLPGFQFIQDDIELSTRTHHSNMDLYDRVVAEDMRVNSVIMASFAYNAAMRDDMLPRPEPFYPEIFRERPFDRMDEIIERVPGRDGPF